MRPIAFALVILVACSHPNGLELEVPPLDGVSSVRVYLGTTLISNIDTLTVPTEASATPEQTKNPQVFVRAFDNDVDVATFQGNHALDFELTATAPEVLGAVLVVGYDGNGEPIATGSLPGINVPSDELVQYTVTMSPLVASATQLFLWGSDTPSSVPTDAECAGLVDADTATFIVTQGDTDCDGVTNHDPNECDQHWWHRTEPAVGAGPCVQLADANSTSCLLGGDGVCTDGVGTTTSATCDVDGATECLPSTDCVRCTGTDDSVACVLQNASTLGYACTLPATNTGCLAVLPMPPTGGVSCVPSGGSNSQAGLGTDGISYTPQLDLGNGVTVTLDVDSACNVTLINSGSASGSAASDVLMRVDLGNGKSLVVPIQITFLGDCSTGNDQCVPPSFDDAELTTCIAGWGSAVDTGLVGLSPTLTPDMTEMLLIAAPSDPDAGEVQHSSYVAGTWTPPAAVGFEGQPPATAVSLHLQGSNTLWIVNDAGLIAEYTRDGPNTWKPGVSIASTLFPEPVSAFAPDIGSNEAIVATEPGSEGAELYDVSGSAIASVIGGGSGAFGTQITAGQTPFLTDDDLNIWYSAMGSNGNLEIYTMSRPARDVMFPPNGTALPELGPSKTTTLMSPWLSQEPTSYLTKIFFTRTAPNGSDDAPHIYSATR
ncbi:MAG TPA: hypothetical protein VGG74_25305 [Kofleriaceae bacterium]|jgi:hypothetical protein